MGQYYEPILIRDDGVKKFYSHDFGNGLKLMEHSYVGNDLMNAVIHDLKEYGPAKLYWVGDYTDQKDLDRKHITDINIKNLEKISDDDELYCKDRADEGEFEKEFYLINRSKNVAIYIDGRKRKGKLNEMWMIHPLSLLTCTCNHSGGSYYSDYGVLDIGTWCGDLIEYSETSEDLPLVHYKFIEDHDTYLVHNDPNEQMKIFDRGTEVDNVNEYYSRNEIIENIDRVLRYNIDTLESYISAINSIDGSLCYLDFRENCDEELRHITDDLIVFANIIKQSDENYNTYDDYFIYENGYLTSYSEAEIHKDKLNYISDVAEWLIDNMEEWKDVLSDLPMYEYIMNMIEYKE